MNLTPEQQNKPSQNKPSANPDYLFGRFLYKWRIHMQELEEEQEAEDESSY